MLLHARAAVEGRVCVLLFLALCIPIAQAVVGFEKLTNLAYSGNSYYTIRNLTLYECQGWCREEPECAAASFSFVSSPLQPVQETLCLLQNETSASNPSSAPSSVDSTYYMIKLNLRSDKVCSRPWTFERVPNKIMNGLDNARIFTSTKEACLSACLNEERFVCRSAEYNYVTLQCHLSEFDRRTVGSQDALLDVTEIDYFENLCLKGNEACRGNREFEQPRLAVPAEIVSSFVDANYYVDLELMASTEMACKRACEIENEILCRSYLFGGPPTGSNYNCQLFHLDHKTFPRGASTYKSAGLKPSASVGIYSENVCRDPRDTSGSLPAVVSSSPASVLPSDVLPPLPGGGNNEITIPETAGGSTDGSTGATGNINGAASSSGNQSPSGVAGDDPNCDSTGTCFDVGVLCRDTRISVQVNTNRPFNGRIYALGRSKTCNINVIRSTSFRLDLSMGGQDCNTQAANTVFSNTVVIQHHSVVMTKTDKIYKVRCTYDMTSRNISFGMMPIRDPDMISITSAPEAPPPSIKIVDKNGQDVNTVQIGDRLSFRIEIPQGTPYAIFARNCIAMAKDAQSTFQIIDDRGCPVDPSIFPRFTSSGNQLQSNYEAFRFTESYGIIFQCNVKYCLGECEPAICDYEQRRFESYGRRRRRSLAEMQRHEQPGEAAESTETESSMTLSREIIVLDFGDHKQEQQPQQQPTQAGNQRNHNTAQVPSYSSFEHETVHLESGENSCANRWSVLMLSVACALMLAVYVLTLAAVLIRRWMQHNNKTL